MADWRIKHGEVIKTFLHELNQNTGDFVLKGDTALKQCYGLELFPAAEIELDSTAQDVIPFAKKFCETYHYELKVAEDRKSLKKCLIQYGDADHPLPLEVSYHSRHISENEITKINAITVYTMDRIAQMKAVAYAARSRIRDLYDMLFICNAYFDSLSPETKNLLTDIWSYKGIKEFDHLVKTQSDPLIEKSKLASDFLEAVSKLGIRLEDEEQEMLERY